VPTVDFPLIGGVDQSTNAKLLTAPRLLRAENLRVVETGALRKRRGTATLAAGTVDAGSPTPVGPVRLATHKNQLLVCSEESLWTVSANDARLEELDAMPSTTLESVIPLGHYGAANVVASGCAETTAFRVWAWTTYDGTDYRLHIQTIDLVRGAGSAATQVTSNGAESQAMKCIKVIAIGAKVTVFWGTDTNTIRYLDITSATDGPFVGGKGTALYTDAVQTSPQWFDVAPHETGYCLVYRSSSTEYKVKRLSSAHAESATGTFAPGTFGSGPRFSIAGNSTSIAVAFVSDNTTALSVVWYNNSIVQTATATFSRLTLWGATDRDATGVAIAPYTGGGAGELALSLNAVVTVGTATQLYKIATLTTAGVLSDANMKSDVQAASKPWVYAGDVYALVRYWYGTQGNSYYAVVRYTGGSVTPIARTNPVLEARVRDSRAVITALDDCAVCVAQTGDAVAVPIPAIDRFSSPGVSVDPTGVEAIDPDETDAVGVQTITLVSVDGFHFRHANRSRWQAVTVGDYTCFSGGVIGKFDGRRRTEIGFPAFPYPTVTQVSTGGALEVGAYYYGVCWEWTDFLGNREQSALYVSGPHTTADTNDYFTISSDSPSFTSKHWHLPGGDAHLTSMAIYRTVGGGTLMHRVEGGGAPLFDEAGEVDTVSVVTYSDQLASTTMSLTSRELVYATSFGSDELQHQMPPPSNVICGHENRLFFVSAEDPTVVGYTLQLFPNQSLAWNASLVIKFDEPIHALASQDGNLLAFADNTIYTVSGRPADNTGRSTGYDPPILLSGHLGTTDRRSVMPSPVGVWFRSQRGLEVLPRGGGNAMWLGERVRDTLDAYPIITGALHNPAASEVLFSLVTAETVGATGVVIAYDYDSDVWFVRDYQTRPISDMTLDGDDVVFGIYNSAAGLTLWREDDGFDDANLAFVSTTLETGDIRIAKASGLQSLWRSTILGECTGRVLLTISDSADGGAYRSVVYKPSTLTELEIQHETFQRKAKRHRLKFVETTAGTADVQGVAYLVCTLELAAMDGSTRSAQMVRG
jgi:hypothetical protein